MVEHYISLGPYTVVRIELVAMTANGPFRLTVEHPARTLVEYFDTPIAALERQAEIESALTGRQARAVPLRPLTPAGRPFMSYS